MVTLFRKGQSLRNLHDERDGFLNSEGGDGPIENESVIYSRVYSTCSIRCKCRGML